MYWARVSYQGQEIFGTVADNALHAHSGNMFDHPTPTGQIIALDDCQWLTPCVPEKFLALWNNFHAAATKNGWAVPVEPFFFVKTPNTYHPHKRPIKSPPPEIGRIVYEGELGIVIGKPATALTPDQAAEAIFGYTCVNDVTAMEQFGTDQSFIQWTRAKCRDGFGVFGPVIATGIDPLTLTVRTLVNGRERQNYPITDMIFKPHEIVSHLSQHISLAPGDVIACGTSLGVLPMRPGTDIAVTIDGIGTLENRFGDVENGQ